jgi:hypothetical protein
MAEPFGYGASGSSPPIRTIRIAPHEAGHAVTAWADGRTVGVITIESSPDPAKGVGYMYTGRTWVKGVVPAHVILAGPIAERMYVLGRSGRQYRRASEVWLRNELWNHYAPQHPLPHGLEMRALEDLRPLWPAVERVAALLLERVTITGDEFKAVMVHG